MVFRSSFIVHHFSNMDTTLTEPRPPANQLAVPPPDVAGMTFPFERAEPQWMNYGDMVRILGTVIVVIGHVSDMMLYQASGPGSKNGPGTDNWHVLNVWDAFSRWAVPIYIMLSGSLLLDPNRVESPSRFYHKRLMRIGVPLVFWSFFFMWVDVYYTGWRATHNIPDQRQYESYLHYDSLTTTKGQTYIGNIDENDTGYSVETAGEKVDVDSADVAKVERNPTAGAGWQFAWSAHTFGQWIHNFIVYNPDQWGGHTRWQWFKYLFFYCPQKAWINLLKGEPYVHMHFIFRIAGLYAFTPVLRVCLRHISRPMLIASVITMLALSSADSIANNFTGTELSAFARFVPFLGYYLAGYLLRNVVISWRALLGCWIGFIASVAALALGEEWLVKHYVIEAGLHAVTGPPSVNMMLYDFLSPVRVVMAIFAWIVVVNLFRNPLPIGKWGRSVIRFWANTTLGLYLIHPFFREFWYMKAPFWLHPYIERILAMHGPPIFHKVQTVLSQWVLDGINASWPTVWKGVPLTTMMVYVPSLIATIIIMRIPYVRRIAG
jgi:surface polysaccharide O-acyltransferase-like enzyme